MYPRDPAGHRVDHFWPIPWGLSGRSTPRALVGVPGVPQTSATPNMGLRTHDFRSFAKNAILAPCGVGQKKRFGGELGVVVHGQAQGISEAQQSAFKVQKW